MDLFDISKLVPFIRPEEYKACWTGHERTDLNKLRNDGVIRGNND